MNNLPVYISECDSYDESLLAEVLRKSFSALGIDEKLISGQKVLLKPNLVLAKSPDHGATTHPAFLKAAAQVMHELGAASIVAADSPGGPFNAQALHMVYRTCEIAPLASDILKINDDFTYSPVKMSGVKLKNLHLINAFMNCDVIVDLCKLKTHTLTKMSCATKNLFGLIPGVEKFEMHSNFPLIEDFSEMLADLSSYVVKNKEFIAVCDAIISMEGNGPSYGVPKKTGLILTSRSPYSLDVIAEHIMKSDGEVLHLNKAAERGLVSRDWREIPVLGLTEYPTFDFLPPDTDYGKFLKNLPTMFGGRVAKFFETKPHVNYKKCVGCGVCAESCPKHTIEIIVKHGKKKAKINWERCIRCYCCGELCPIGAVEAKQNPLIRLIH